MARVELTETVLRPDPVSGALSGVSGASVTVNVRGGSAATLYAASTGGTTVAQPLTTRYGRVEPVSAPGGEVWVEAGSYDLVVGGVMERFEAAPGLAQGGVQFVSVPGDLAAGQGTLPLAFPFDVEILAVTPTLGEQANLDVIVDVNKNGTTIFTDQAERPRVIAGAQQGARRVPAVATLAAGERLTFDRDQVGGPAAPNYVSKTGLTTNTTTPRAVARPSGTQLGDQHLIFVGVTHPQANTPTVTPPAGWTQVGTAQRSADNGANTYTLFTYRNTDDGTASPTWNFAFTNHTNTVMTLVTYHSISSLTPVDAYAVAQIAYGKNMTSPSVTPSQANGVLVQALMLPGGTVTAAAATPNVRHPQSAGLYVADGILTAPGVATGVITATNTADVIGIGASVILKADAAASQPGADLSLAIEYTAA